MSQRPDAGSSGEPPAALPPGAPHPEKAPKKKRVVINDQPETMRNPHAVPGAPPHDPYLLGQSRSPTRPATSSARWTWRPSLDAARGRPFRRAALLCQCSPAWLPSRSQTVGYTSGILFAAGWWLFLDAFVCTLQAAWRSGSPPVVPLQFTDWVPGLVATAALLVVNLIDRDALASESSALYDSPHSTDRARLCAFVGLTLALGAICGSMVLYVINFVNQGHTGAEAYLGVAQILQSVLIFMGSMTLWLGRQQSEGDISL